jgi:transcriptional antiterminator
LSGFFLNLRHERGKNNSFSNCTLSITIVIFECHNFITATSSTTLTKVHFVANKNITYMSIHLNITCNLQLIQNDLLKTNRIPLKLLIFYFLNFCFWSGHFGYIFFDYTLWTFPVLTQNCEFSALTTRPRLFSFLVKRLGS